MTIAVDLGRKATKQTNKKQYIYIVYSALDKLLGQLGIYATWLSSIAYLQKQLRIFIFFMPFFFSVITPFLIA